jgi:signal transduction histidine kinase
MRRHVMPMDGVLALAVLGLGLLNNLPGGEPGRVALFTPLLALPLIWRRRAPVAVFGVAAAVAFVQWLQFRPLFADTALFVALYSVATARPRRVAIAATAVLEGGALLATIRWSANEPWIQTFVLLSGAVVAAVVSGVYMRARQRHVADLVERARRLEFERDQQARLAATAERARIAREMHDTIAHTLAVVISLANGASAKLRRDPEQTQEALESISDLGGRALADIRQLLSVLRTDDGGGTAAVQPGVAEIADLVDQAATTGLEARLTVRGADVPLATGPALGAYRIVQEAITNTLKHATGATAVEVELAWDPQLLQITVSDNGASDGERLDETRGFGLAGMRERAALFGGRATAGPRPTGGWTVQATIPTARRGAR